MITMNNNKADKSIHGALEDFIRYKEARNKAERTIKYYRNRVSKFAEWVDEELEDIDEHTIDDYIRYFKKNTDRNSSSINSDLRAVRAFIYYCQKFNYCKKFKVELLETTEKVKETYTNREIQLLLKKPDTKTCNFPEYRNWVIVNFLLATGVRLGTLINIRVGDLDFDNALINLSHNKNRKAQIIPMSRTLHEVLNEYLIYRNGESKDYLFCNGKNGKQLTKQGMKMAVRRYHTKRGLGSYSIHKYRHTFAKLAIKNGVDVFTLQKLLGHSDLTVTRQYVNLFSEDLQDGFNDYCPLEQFSNKGKSIKMR